MFITAKFTKLSCFVNTVLQLCLILGKLLILCRLSYNLSQTVRKSHAGCKGAYDLSALSHFNAINYVVGQGHLTPFSTRELMAYKIKF